MLVVEIAGDDNGRDERRKSHSVLVPYEGVRYRSEQPKPAGADHGDYADREQRDDEVLLLRSEQRNDIHSRKRDGGHARPPTGPHDLARRFRRAHLSSPG